MTVRNSLVILVALIAAYALGAQGRDGKPEIPPHAAALELIFNSHAPAKFDGAKNEWWHDTKERTWVVKRPFAPGVIDSTHRFDVTYRIDGKEISAWMVDTRKGTIQSVDASPKQK
jgi:hypothetical protein